jgi:hypothetical protein
VSEVLNADGSRNLTVAICVPCQDAVAANFAFDLANLIGFTVANAPQIRLLSFVNKGTIIPEQRHLLVRHALAKHPTHILWIDSDMRFPKDALLRLLAHEKDVVGCNYATRRAPCIPTASFGPVDELLFSAPEDTDLVPVARMGMGLMLCEASIFTKVIAPWFAIGFNREQDGYAGEDIFFCDLMQRNGISTWVDPVLSRELKHCGEFEYQLVHADITKKEFLNQQRADSAARAAAVASGPAPDGP